LVFNTSVGQTIELTVLRNGEQIAVPLTLGERP
jgi:S1-C subfamily serine protease